MSQDLERTLESLRTDNVLLLEFVTDLTSQLYCLGIESEWLPAFGDFQWVLLRKANLERK